jgi:pyrophosphatase PpaX
MIGPIKNIVFDFDGTLVDTMPSVIAGLTEAVRVGTGKVVSKNELVATFGGSPLTVLRHWMPEERVSEAFQAWIDFENASGPESMVPFEGVETLLKTLKKNQINIGIFTGRDRPGTVRIAKAHNWIDSFFSEECLVCGDDGFPAKPSGEALKYLLQKKNWAPSETLMVGDHPYDMQAGREAKTKVAAALWDMPKSGGTQRSRFKEAWQKWDSVDTDLRLDEPMSLARMFQIY